MPRYSFTTLQNESKDFISQASGSFAASTIANFIKRNLNAGYHQIQAELRGYINQDPPQTATTTADQQYYHYPPGVFPPIESATWTVGSRVYPLTVIHSQKVWDQLNEIEQNGGLPEAIFPRRDDFGLYPIPSESSQTLTLVSSLMDRDMTADDYTTGTVTVTSNSATVTGSGTTWTAAMGGRWFTLTDSNGNPQDNWYRINAGPATTELTLESVYEGTTTAGLTYIIAETPELPPEIHELLPHYVAMKFYMGPRKDKDAAKMHSNMFYYGDPAPNYDQINRPLGGLKGAKRRYASRDNSAIVHHATETKNPFDERFTTTLS